MPCVLIGVAQIIILYLFIIFLYHGNIENHDHLEVLRKNVDISTINLREEIVKIEVATPTVRNDHVDLTVTDNTHLVVKKNTIQLKDDSQSSSPSLSNVPFSLPGASKGMHSILSLSDEEFDKISISAMMAQYGEAEGGGTCPIDFGNQLVNRWRGEKKSNCDSHESLSQTDQSSIDCYLVRQTRHHGNGDNICRMYNVSIDLSIFANRQATRGVIQQYVATTHSKQPYMSLPRGTVQGTCHPNANFKQKSMPGWNEDWTVNSFEEVKSLSCDHWVDHKILIIQRDTFANFFHDSEDFTNAFLAFAILQWSRSSSQIFLTDLYPEGPFWPIWAQAFSSKMSQKLPPEDVRSRDLQGVQAGGKVLTSWDISQNLLFNSPGKRTCFRDIAVGIYGPASPITVASWDTPCFKTALVRGRCIILALYSFITSLTNHHPLCQHTLILLSEVCNCRLELTMLFQHRAKLLQSYTWLVVLAQSGQKNAFATQHIPSSSAVFGIALEFAV